MFDKLWGSDYFSLKKLSMKNINSISHSLVPEVNKLDASPASSKLELWSRIDPAHGPDDIVMELIELLKPGSTVFEF